MTDIPLHVARFEHGILRIWSFDRDSETGRRLLAGMEAQPRDTATAMDVLGATRVDPYWLDLVRLADIPEMGLAGYLRQAYEVPQDEAERVTPSGDHVLIAPSRAFGDHEQTLSPDPALTPLGALNIHEDVGKLRHMDPVVTAQREPGTPEANEPQPGAPASRGLRWGSILMLLVIAAGFIWIVAR
jgi:hypothetical protein